MANNNHDTGISDLDDALLGHLLQFSTCGELCACNQTCKRMMQRSRVDQQTELCLVQDYVSARTERRNDAPRELSRLAVLNAPTLELTKREAILKCGALGTILKLASKQVRVLECHLTWTGLTPRVLTRMAPRAGKTPIHWWCNWPLGGFPWRCVFRELTHQLF